MLTPTLPWPTDDVDPTPPWRGAGHAEVVVIGGGLAGLAIASHLVRARPGMDVVLLEADRIAAGATGRGTGMVGPGVGLSIPELRARFGDEVAQAAHQATLDGVAGLCDLVEREGLACDLARGPQLHATFGSGARKLERLSASYRALGFDVPVLDAQEVALATGTSLYSGALLHSQAALVNPRRLATGLARVLRARGVRVHEGTRVVGIEPGTPARVRTERGVITAGRVIVATNAYTSGLGLLRGQVVPLLAHALVTEPLTGAQRDAIGLRHHEAVIDRRTFFLYYRLTPDARLLVGGGPVAYRRDPRDAGAGATSGARPASWERIEREVEALFPGLAPLAWAARWTGPTGFTNDRLAVVGDLVEAPGVLFAGGWCGHGLALSMHAAARIAAHVVEGAPLPALPWVRGHAPALPRDPLRAALLGGLLAGLDVIDQLGPGPIRARRRAGRQVGAISGGVT